MPPPPPYAARMAKKAAKPAPLTADTRVAVLHGKDLFAKTEYTALLRRQLEAAHGEIDTFLFDGDTAQPAEVLDECRSFGLMSGHKLIIVDAAEKLITANSRPLMERYCESPSDGATLVLRADTWRPGNIDKLIAACGSVIKCEPPTEEQCAMWAQRRAKQTHGVELDPDAARMIVDQIGPDLGTIDQEVAKLAVAAEAGVRTDEETPSEPGRITQALVHALCGGDREIPPWEVQQALLARTTEDAIAGIRRILESAPRDAHVPAAMAAVQLARTLHGITASKAAGTGAESGKAYATWGPAGRITQQAAGRLAPARARTLLKAALDTDAAGKSGLGDPRRNLETLAVRFSEALGR